MGNKEKVESIWDLFRLVKKDTETLSSKDYHDRLVEILYDMDESVIERLNNDFYEKRKKLIGNRDSREQEEFDKLHISRGGIVNAGDDGFYMDFASWVVAQGEVLYNDYMTKGHTAILTFIAKHHVPANDYLFECLGYVFGHAQNPRMRWRNIPEALERLYQDYTSPEDKFDFTKMEAIGFHMALKKAINDLEKEYPDWFKE